MKWLTELVDAAKAKSEIRKRISGLVAEEFKKSKQYKALVGTELNYPIIQDLVNSAARGVEVVVTLPGGTAIKISQQAAPDALARLREYQELY